MRDKNLMNMENGKIYYMNLDINNFPKFPKTPVPTFPKTEERK
jgi:hypothetical protein